MIGASFDSTKTPLLDLLARADGGKLQLPDFQRGWVWDDDRIRSLLASVSVSFPIGAVMLLETGGQHVRFKPRPLTGTHERLRQIANSICYFLCRFRANCASSHRRWSRWSQDRELVD
jgi:hypothetical protein